MRESQGPYEEITDRKGKKKEEARRKIDSHQEESEQTLWGAVGGPSAPLTKRAPLLWKRIFEKSARIISTWQQLRHH